MTVQTLSWSLEFLNLDRSQVLHHSYFKFSSKIKSLKLIHFIVKILKTDCDIEINHCSRQNMTFFRCPLSLEVRILRSWENWIFLPLQNYGKTSSAVSDCLEKFWFKCATCMIDTVHCCCSGVFIVNFEQISHIGLVFPLLTFNKQMPAGKQITKVNKPMISPKNG